MNRTPDLAGQTRPTDPEWATVLAQGKVRCSPSSPCARRRRRCAWLRVAPLLPSPPLRAAPTSRSGRDEKTALQPNQKTMAGAITPERTTHALQKADIFTRHRQTLV